jgi:hypothetical protein
MITVGELLKQLEQYPLGAFVYAYEGEITGVVIVDDECEELGVILAPAQELTDE